MNCSWWAAKWRQGILVLVATAGAVSPVWGQSELPPEAPMEVQLNITSEPPGVVVELHGQYDWVGMTPWALYRPLSGVYRVEVRHPGYQTWSRDVVLGPGGIKDLHIELSEKSRIRAGLRSAILPGWGQRYNEKSKRGTLLFLAEAGALVGMFLMNSRYDDNVDDYELAKTAYLESRQIGRIPGLRQELEAEARRADEAWDDYKLAENIALALYAFGIVDALFNGPDRTRAYSPKGTHTHAKIQSETGPALGWNASRSPEGSTRFGLRFQF